MSTISPDYFRVLGMQLTMGRAFEETDREGSKGVVVANEAFVRRYFPSGDCLGKRISVETNEWLTIVGIVPDVRGFSYDQDKVPLLYRPYMQDGRSHMQLIVRTAGDPLQLAAAVKDRIRSIDRGQPPHDITTLDQEASDFLAPQRIDMWLLTAFAGTALILAAIGIYGVISYSVSRRTHEIGVRTAMGARPSDVLRLVLGQGMLLVAIGLGIGLAASLALGGIITSMLYEVSINDPTTLAGTALLLALVALLACYIPARRATQVDPMVALRNE
jgi:putative ABC transport system permease protein